ncbi:MULTISPECIES: dTDP-4-dehydrorhamnose 3,5-epimerase family protein [unclassified Pseudoalteromonas]|uniref:dTDP-4-dehydrorhamnose 3,5-epimerase family protein n=1 Tax=unclassified Pseudoalteromonas TaxID=194690 RepID=UPI000F64B0A7|nr:MULTISPECIES: dTDP-4-dehydrorhamnose 3,5-epimerase family protein [unclassified Pseudoalteromonas]RRS09037.1 dTDP-4-keto-6-deoxy-D-glucose epimerase [Pseudoalteromonas sp. J010]RXF07176.1 dTDP-4-keto-6-deoxy-D-glucose epimerase [Pseudoalteromonas sp. PS5]
MVSTLRSLSIQDVFLSERTAFSDARGSFAKWFDEQALQPVIGHSSICQVNSSYSAQAGTLRGMHCQLGSLPEYKMVRCINGRVLDLIVDLRQHSVSFLECIQIELDTPDKMLIIPPGCAHGFLTLEEDCEMLYFHTAPYEPEHEFGVRYDDKLLSFELPIPVTVYSDKDAQFQTLPCDFDGVTI